MMLKFTTFSSLIMLVSAYWKEGSMGRPVRVNNEASVDDYRDSLEHSPDKTLTLTVWRNGVIDGPHPNCTDDVIPNHSNLALKFPLKSLMIKHGDEPITHPIVKNLITNNYNKKLDSKNSNTDERNVNVYLYFCDSPNPSLQMKVFDRLKILLNNNSFKNDNFKVNTDLKILPVLDDQENYFWRDIGNSIIKQNDTNEEDNNTL